MSEVEIEFLNPKTQTLVNSRLSLVGNFDFLFDFIIIVITHLLNSRKSSFSLQRTEAAIEQRLKISNELSLACIKYNSPAHTISQKLLPNDCSLSSVTVVVFATFLNHQSAIAAIHALN
ncbi:hypothetical protein REPUB_Repub15cG0033400 [Reevesia pubescens]